MLLTPDLWKWCLRIEYTPLLYMYWLSTHFFQSDIMRWSEAHKLVVKACLLKSFCQKTRSPRVSLFSSSSPVYTPNSCYNTQYTLPQIDAFTSWRKLDTNQMKCYCKSKPISFQSRLASENFMMLWVSFARGLLWLDFGHLIEKLFSFLCAFWSCYVACLQRRTGKMIIKYFALTKNLVHIFF